MSKYWKTSWNPAVGCEPVSEGCKNCWAKVLHERRWTSNAMLAGGAAIGFNAAARVREAGMALPFPRQYDQRFSKIQLLPARLSEPLRWRKPRTVAVCFMGDLFHEQVPDEFIAAVFGIMAAAAQHTFLVLTKRPERMRDWTEWVQGGDLQPSETRASRGCGLAVARVLRDRFTQFPGLVDLARHGVPWPLPNVWLGVTAENQRMANKRIPLLLKTPAAHRWASVEPALGAINLYEWLQERAPSISEAYGPRGKIDWCVVGGESGPGYREMAMPWVERLSVQCDLARVPFYGKQRAATRPGQPLPGYLGRKELPWQRP